MSGFNPSKATVNAPNNTNTNVKKKTPKIPKTEEQLAKKRKLEGNEKKPKVPKEPKKPKEKKEPKKPREPKKPKKEDETKDVEEARDQLELPKGILDGDEDEEEKADREEEEKEDVLFDDEMNSGDSEFEMQRMQLLLDNATPEQTNRYEYYRRSCFTKSTLKKVIGNVYNGPIFSKAIIVMGGATKVFVGEVTECARSVMDEWGETGPIRPRHIREAYRRLKNQGKIPSAARRNPFMRR